MDLLLRSYSASILLTGMKTHRVGIVERSERRRIGLSKTNAMHIETPTIHMKKNTATIPDYFKHISPP